MSKKTIRIDDVLTQANNQLAREDQWVTQEFKAGVCCMLENILMATGNYHGFNNIHWNEKGGYEAWIAAGKPEGEEKYKYIYGPQGKEGAEYNRRYYE